MTVTTGTVLAFDVGKTGCRAALSIGGVRVAASECGGARGLADPGGPQAALEAMARAAAELTTEPVDAVGAGLAGLTRLRSLGPELAAALERRHGTSHIVLAGDMTTSHLGALRGAAGAVVAAGTGAVALAVAASGASAVADGWGYLLGDAGSGADLGRRGLDQALRAHDGRGGSRALMRLAEDRFGDLDDLPRLVHHEANPPRLLATFARDVLLAAEDGDPVARALWADAGRELARTTAAVVQHAMPWQETTEADTDAAAALVRISTTGGLFGAGELLTGPFAAELARLLPRHDLVPRAGDACDGAHLMATTGTLPHDPLLIRPGGPR